MVGEIFTFEKKELNFFRVFYIYNQISAHLFLSNFVRKILIFTTMQKVFILCFPLLKNIAEGWPDQAILWLAFLTRESLADGWPEKAEKPKKRLWKAKCLSELSKMFFSVYIDKMHKEKTNDKA